MCGYSNIMVFTKFNQFVSLFARQNQERENQDQMVRHPQVRVQSNLLKNESLRHNTILLVSLHYHYLCRTGIFDSSQPSGNQY